MTTTEVRDNPDEGQFEIVVDGKVAGLTQYRRRDGKAHFVHTEIDDAYEGQGLASKLVRGALDQVRGWNEPVVAECSYVAGWIDKHPEYQDLLAA
jgi:predicted GNAT family acetyltransferase